MAYATMEDLLVVESAQTLQQLTDDERAGETNAELVGSAIAAADAEIDGYLRRRHPILPLSPVPAIIREASCVLTLARLYSRRRGDALPGTLRDDVKRAREILADVADGKIDLGADTPAATAGFYRSNKTAEDRIYPPGFDGMDQP